MGTLAKKITKYCIYISGGAALLSLFFLGVGKHDSSSLGSIINTDTAFADDTSCATCDTCSSCSGDGCGSGGDGCGGGGGDDGT